MGGEKRKWKQHQRQEFELVSTAIYIFIPPVFSRNPLKGVQLIHLDPYLLTFQPELGGVVVAYDNISFKEPLGKIMYDSPFSFSWVQADFLVWRPSLGQVMTGRVHTSSASHIGLLVLNIFNASISINEISPDWRFIEEEDKTYWTDANGVQIPDELSFTVKQIILTDKTLALEGSLH